jgi:hypothetical protein
MTRKQLQQEELSNKESSCAGEERQYHSVGITKIKKRFKVSFRKSMKDAFIKPAKGLGAQLMLIIQQAF